MPEVPLPDAFEWTRFPWGPAIRCRALAGVADHCFTTRAPALGTGPLTPGDGWHRVALAMGIPPNRLSGYGRCMARASCASGGTRRFPLRRPIGASATSRQRPSRVAVCVKVTVVSPSCWPTAERECCRRPCRLARHRRRRGESGGRGAQPALRGGASTWLRPSGRASVRAATASGRTYVPRSRRPARRRLARRLVQPDADFRGIARSAGVRPRRVRRRTRPLPRHVGRQRRSVARRGCAGVADPRLTRLHVLLSRDLPFVSGGWGEGGKDGWDYQEEVRSKSKKQEAGGQTRSSELPPSGF